MRDYESIAKRVLSRRDALLAKQRRRHEIFVRCTAVGGSLCACAVIAIGVHLGINRLPKPPIDPSVQSSQVDDTTSFTTTTTTTSGSQITETTVTTVTEETKTTESTCTIAVTQTTTGTTQTTEPFTPEETTTATTTEPSSGEVSGNDSTGPEETTTLGFESTTTLRSEITTSFTTTETTTTSETTGYQPNSWAEKGIWALYPTIRYTNAQDPESTTVIYTATNVIINVGRIGEHLATVRLTAYDEFGVQHEIGAELYAIDGYDVESAIAVRYAGHDEFYMAER